MQRFPDFPLKSKTAPDKQTQNEFVSEQKVTYLNDALIHS